MAHPPGEESERSLVILRSSTTESIIIQLSSIFFPAIARHQSPGSGNLHNPVGWDYARANEYGPEESALPRRITM